MSQKNTTENQGFFYRWRVTFLLLLRNWDGVTLGVCKLLCGSGGTGRKNRKTFTFKTLI